MATMTVRCVLTATVLALVGGRADAGLMTYTETAMGTGSFGGTDFTFRLITLSVTADPSVTVSPFPGSLGIADVTVRIDVEGIGSGTTTGYVFRFDDGNPAHSVVGIGGNLPSFSDILDATSPAFSGYDLVGPIGPITGTPTINPGFAFTTSNGNFIIDVIQSPTTFTATVVPEPSSLALCGIAGLTGLSIARSRRKAA